MNNNYVLYLHVSPSGKRYFGITKQKPERRWSNGYGYKKNDHFWNAIKKYGWSNMGHYILADNLTKEEACFFEKVMIALYESNNPNYGYNETNGGEHFNHSERTRRILSISQQGENNSMYGRCGELNPMYGVRGYDNPTSKTVICITTGQCFGSVRNAARYYNVNPSIISACCRNEKKSAGKLNGEKLVWKYVQDIPKPQLSDSDKVHLRNLLNKYSA